MEKGTEFPAKASGAAGNRRGATIRAMKASIVFVAALLVLPMAASADESFRCGKWIASSDMSLEELVQKCGEPASRTTEVQDVMVRNRDNGLMRKVGETQIEKWTYDRGPQAAPMVVTIVDGRIKNIERQK
jgi:hypothetical protein